MTELLVKPIDPEAKGSYRLRSRIFRALQAIGSLKDGDADAGFAAIAAFVEVEDIVLSQISTDDDTPVEDVLDVLSADQFDELLQGLLQSPVPPESTDA